MRRRAQEIERFTVFEDEMPLLALLLTTAAMVPPGFEVDVDEARYVFRHIFDGGYALAPRDKRLLVVRYRVKNNASYPLQYSRQSVAVSVVAGEDRFTAGAAPLHMTGHDLDESGPGKTRTDETWIEVPVGAVDPKLNIRATGAERTFDLSQAKPDASVWRDTADTLEVELKKAVPLGPWDVGVLSVSRPVTSPTVRVNRDDNEELLVAEIEFRNAVPEETYLTSGVLHAELLDADGKTLPAKGAFFTSSTDNRVDRTLKGDRLALHTPNPTMSGEQPANG
ncbi:hypothetical protein EON81_29160, partial [bacterium]